MSVQQTMEDVMQPLEYVQIQRGVVLVLAKLVILEMVSLVMVTKFFIIFIFTPLLQFPPFNLGKR